MLRPSPNANFRKLLRGMIVHSFVMLSLFAAVPEDMAVPAVHQIKAIFSVLTYDLNFEKKWPTELKIGIVYAPGNAGSLKAKDDIVGVLEKAAGRTIKRVPIKYLAMEFTSRRDFENLVKSNKLNVLYITPGNAQNLDVLLKISQSNQIITVTGVPGYVDQGVSVGIGVRKDKPHLWINLSSSKSEGSKFDASLLQLQNVSVVR